MRLPVHFQHLSKMYQEQALLDTNKYANIERIERAQDKYEYNSLLNLKTHERNQLFVVVNAQKISFSMYIYIYI